jgi:hypothetical protein
MDFYITTQDLIIFKFYGSPNKFLKIKIPADTQVILGKNKSFTYPAYYVQRWKGMTSQEKYYRKKFGIVIPGSHVKKMDFKDSIRLTHKHLKGETSTWKQYLRKTA